MSRERLQYLKQKYRENDIPLMKFNLFGIRNENKLDKDSINDILGFFTVDELFTCEGTTDPSVYWTKSTERNKGGTFHLLDGYHENIWTHGIHGGYEALVNDYRKCQPTKGWRDADYNFKRGSTDPIVSDFFGVNFHRMGKDFIAKAIGKYSSGCQAVLRPDEFNYILKKAKESEQELFSYMLFNINDIEVI